MVLKEVKAVMLLTYYQPPELCSSNRSVVVSDLVVHSRSFMRMHRFRSGVIRGDVSTNYLCDVVLFTELTTPSSHEQFLPFLLSFA